MIRFATWIAGLVVALLAILGTALLVVDTDPGHRWVVQRIARVETANGLRFRIGRIDGSLYGRATLRDVRVLDPRGLVFSTPRADLDWSPLRWFTAGLDVTALHMARATLHKLPQTRPDPTPGPLLPDFDVRIGRLAIDRLDVAAPVTGEPRTGRVEGRADLHAGRALVDLTAIVAGTDRVVMRIDAIPDRDRFDLGVRVEGAANGVVARWSGLNRALDLDISGDGRWTQWRGRALGLVGGARVVDLALGARSGDYTLSGQLAPSAILRGRLHELTRPRVLVAGHATYANRRVEGALSLRSAALAADVTGGIDLAARAWRNVRVAARLLRPPALLPTMTGRNIALRLILDGAFETAAFDYRLAADSIVFDDTGFVAMRVAGRGRLSRLPLLVPVHVTATRVIDSDSDVRRILDTLTADGVLRIGDGVLTADRVQVRSTALTARVNLFVDLATGRFEIGIDGGLGRYLVPGLGIVDVASILRVVPSPAGKPRVIGRATAQMVRLDNAFFRSLTGGLPRVTADIERTADNTLFLRNLVLTSPKLRLLGNGWRRRDGIYHFEGTGRHADYGALTLRLDGRIDKPTIDLTFASPIATLGLANVRLHLDPTAEGFAFTAGGGSRAGSFAMAGAILLAPGRDARVRVDRLDVAGTRATGLVDIVDGGLAGRLAIAGGGLTGELLLRPVGTVQRVEAHVDAVAATFANLTLRRGRLDLVALLDPAGTTIEATATGTGLSRGALTLARFAGNARLRGGVGEVRASISGARGRRFEIQSVAQVAPDRITLAAQGNVDRRPIRLETPAVLTRDDDGWRLAPTRLAFAGGTAQFAGRLSGASTTIDATLMRMPLGVLDIAYPGLGLSGSASGKLAFALVRDAAPTGSANLTIRGLSRSGIVVTSRPIDVGIAAILTADKAAMRAVMASGGQTIGRAQMLLTPLAGGDLETRLRAAPVFGQLRYSGPADTLWRLTGVELFDLSGPVAIGADVRGRLADPVIRGVVQATGARIESATTGTVLSNVQASGRFAGSQLAIDRFAADAGKGGRVTGTGRFDFAAAHGIGLDLSLQADNAVMIARDDIGATVTGPLTFRSDGRGGRIAGDVRLVRSRYRLGQATAASALPQLNIREINVPGGDEAPAVPDTPWTLDIRARAPNQLSVSGLGLRSEWSADLQIGGAPANPAITGRATLIRGDYEFAGRQFDLARGIIRFAGEVPANPALDIEANANVTGLNATIRVTGVALKPEITFASTPALPQDELLSRLLFGTSITNLSAPEALQLAAAVAALQGGGGGLNPINAVRRAAGLDRLRILPADPQTGQGTSIAAGKYITRRFYAEIVTDGQGYSATQVEFQVTRWLSLLSSISTLGRQSANVRVSRDY